MDSFKENMTRRGFHNSFDSDNDQTDIRSNRHIIFLNLTLSNYNQNTNEFRSHEQKKYPK